jgi:hypothetical protein
MLKLARQAVALNLCALCSGLHTYHAYITANHLKFTPQPKKLAASHGVKKVAIMRLTFITFDVP